MAVRLFLESSAENVDGIYGLARGGEPHVCQGPLSCLKPKLGPVPYRDRARVSMNSTRSGGLAERPASCSWDPELKKYTP